MTLTGIYSQQLSQLEKLQVLLEREQGVLLSMPIDGDLLSGIADDKQAAFSQLQLLENQRRDTSQLEPSYQGTRTPKGLSASKSASDQWQQVLLLARRVSHLNRVNGSIIGRQLIHNQKALNILAEISGRHDYGSDGKAKVQTNKLNISA